MSPISDTGAQALVQIQPDFEGFEAALTRSLQRAIANVEKSSKSQLEVALKVDEGQGAKALKKNFEGLDSSTEKIQKTFQDMASSIQESTKQMLFLTKALKESNKLAKESSSAFSKLVTTIFHLVTAASSAVTVFRFIQEQMDKTREIGGFKNRVVALGKELIGLGQTLNHQIQGLRQAENGFKQAGNSVGQLAKKVTGNNQALQRSSNATAGAARSARNAARDTANHTKATVRNSDAVRKAGDAQRRLRAEVAAGSNPLKGLVSGVSNLSKSLSSGVVESSKKAGKGLKDLVSGVSTGTAGGKATEKISAGFKKLFDTVSSGSGTAVKKAGDSFKGLFSSLSGGGAIEKATQGLKGLFSAVSGGAGTGIEKAAGGLKALFGAVSGGTAAGVEKAAGGLRTLFQSISGGTATAAEKAAGGLRTLFSSISGGTATAAEKAAGGLRTLFQSISGGTASAAEKAAGGLRTLFQSISGNTASAAEKAAGGLRTLFQSISGNTATAAEKAAGGLRTLFQSISSGGGNAAEKAATGLSSLFRTISSNAGTAATKSAAGISSLFRAIATGGKSTEESASLLEKFGGKLASLRDAPIKAATGFKNFTDTVRGVNRVTPETAGFVDKLNFKLLGLADATRTTGDRFAKFAIASKIAKKIVGDFALGTVKNTDEILAAVVRVNSALGGGKGIFGGAGFALGLTSTIGLVTTLATVMTAGSAAIIAFAQKASTANEAINALQVTLGGASVAKSFKDLIGDSTDLGLSGASLNQALTPIIPLLKDTGLAGDALASKLDELVRRAVDLSSVFNVDVNQAITAIGAAIRGENEPIRRLGISFGEADVQAAAAAAGFKKVGGEFAQTDKQAARLQILLEKSAFAMGDFANTSTSVANAQRVLGAKIADITGSISKAFLPAAERLVQVFIQLAEKNGPNLTKFFASLEPLITAFAGLFANLANVASQTGGIFATILIPLLGTVATALKFATPILTAFITKFFVIKAVTTILQIFTAVLALLPAQLNGVAIATGVLSQQVGNLLRPLGLFILATQLLGTKINSTNLIMGSLAKVLKIVEPLIRFLLIRMVALKAVPAIVTAINLALQQLSARLALTTAQTQGLTAGLGRLVTPIALGVAAISIFNKSMKSTSDVVKEISDASKKAQFGPDSGDITKKFDDLIKRSKSFGDNVSGALNNLFHPTKSRDEAFFDIEAGKVEKVLTDLFNQDPKIAENLVLNLEKNKDRFAAKAREVFDTLKPAAERAAEAAAQSVEDALKSVKASQSIIDSLLKSESALEDAREKVSDLDTKIADKRKEIDLLNRGGLAVAKEELDARNKVVDAQQKLVDLEIQLRELQESREQALFEEQRRREEFEPKLAEFEDQQLSANIALARAKRDAQKAQDELNKAVQDGIPPSKLTLDLSKLTLDQARARLRAVREGLAAQRLIDESTGKGKDDTKSIVELQEDNVLAQIGVRDAERQAADVTKSKADFIRDNTIAQREFNEQQQAFDTEQAQIARDKQTALLDQKIAAQDLQKILAGETGIKKQIKDATKEITDLEKDRKKAAEDVAQKEAEVALAVAESRGDEEAIVAAKRTLNDLQFKQLSDSKLISEEYRVQNKLLTDQQTILGDLGFKGAVKTLDQLNKDLKNTTSLLGPGIARSQLVQQVLTPDVITNLLQNRAVSRGGQRLTEISPELPKKIIEEISKALIFDPNSDLRELLKKVLSSLGLSIPGFAKGGIIEGVAGAQGTLIRAGEYGRREAILPLTQPYYMGKMLQNPQVLNPVLAALPTVSLADSSKPTAVTTTNYIQQPSTTATGTRISSSAPQNQGAQEKAKERKLLAQAIAKELASVLGDTGSKTLNVDQTINNIDPALAAREAERAIRNAWDKL